ncbi:MAG: hypothetical protein HPY71_08290 [Firmicutes bacterium]|nr:hypothetical protein [Bacillota bacterium]
MAIATDRRRAMEITERLRRSGVPMAVFCTASHWNTEAILLAARHMAERYSIKDIPVAVAMTFTYENMPQACRITYSQDPQAGFISIMEHLKALCGRPTSPYYDVTVLPHLDHADPQKDRWALTEGADYLASVMFDAQKYPWDENVALTADYVKAYGDRVLVEGIFERLSVEGRAKGSAETAEKAAGAGKADSYVSDAVEYMKRTKVDFLVADLGTEQQTRAPGGVKYLKDRARLLTERLGAAMLVLHGTSSLSNDQMQDLGADGVVRVNMWTRIAREAGQYAAGQLVARKSLIDAGEFEAAESRQYLYDSIEQAARIMEDILEILGYARLR